MNDTNYISKISIATIKCNPVVAKVTNSRTAIAHIYGIASGCKPAKNTATGDVHYPLIGQFEAVNLQTGEVFGSGKLFLPAGIHEMLSSMFLENEAADPVKFGLEISSEPAKNPIGYSYSARPLIESTVNDPLTEMRLSIGEQRQALIGVSEKTVSNDAPKKTVK